MFAGGEFCPIKNTTAALLQKGANTAALHGRYWAEKRSFAQKKDFARHLISAGRINTTPYGANPSLAT